MTTDQTEDEKLARQALKAAYAILRDAGVSNDNPMEDYEPVVKGVVAAMAEVHRIARRSNTRIVVCTAFVLASSPYNGDDEEYLETWSPTSRAGCLVDAFVQAFIALDRFDSVLDSIAEFDVGSAYAAEPFLKFLKPGADKDVDNEA